MKHLSCLSQFAPDYAERKGAVLRYGDWQQALSAKYRAKPVTLPTSHDGLVPQVIGRAVAKRQAGFELGSRAGLPVREVLVIQ